jgi:Xaa-Pro aminopeptidase
MKNKIFKFRINSLRRNLSLSNSRAFISFYPKDIRFLSGFNSSNVCCLLTRDDFIIITDNRYSEDVTSIKNIAKILITADSSFETLSKVVQNYSFEEVLLQTEKHSIKTFNEVVKIFGKKTVRLEEKLIDQFISSHDAYGIESIKNAIKIAEKSFLEIIPLIKEGITEIDLQAELRYRLNKNGSEGENFHPIVLFRNRTSLPHGKSTRNKLKKNSPILIDWGGVVNGYNSDLARNIYFGKPTERYIQVHELVRRANEMSIKMLKHGSNVRELHKNVIQYFEKYRLTKYFVHGLGHGLGMELHSYPRISSNSGEKLMQNQIVTIEPGLYFPSLFGVRIEDDILIKEKSVEKLSALPRELIIL